MRTTQYWWSREFRDVKHKPKPCWTQMVCVKVASSTAWNSSLLERKEILADRTVLYWLVTPGWVAGPRHSYSACRVLLGSSKTDWEPSWPNQLPMVLGILATTCLVWQRRQIWMLSTFQWPTEPFPRRNQASLCSPVCADAGSLVASFAGLLFTHLFRSNETRSPYKLCTRASRLVGLDCDLSVA